MTLPQPLDKRWLPEAEFRAIYSKVTRVCVDLIVSTRNGLIMTKRSVPPAVGMWHIPGGTILFGESIGAALTRIGRSEICLTPKQFELLGVIEYSETEQERGMYTIALAYLIPESSGQLCSSDQGLEFTLIKKLPENTIPEQKLFLKQHWSKISARWTSA